MGYHRAGFEVVGVDLHPQSHYPFEFHQGDALTFPLEGFDAIHASPPCQDYSKALRHFATGYPRLIEDVLSMVQGRNWVIENVPGAPLWTSDTLWGDHGVLLCGSMFGLRVRRHRLFQTSFPLPVYSLPCDHRKAPLNPYNASSRKRDGIESHAMDHYARAMGIEWVKGRQIGEGIPPAYTQWIGERLLAELEEKR